MEVTARLVKAFTKDSTKGNPAGVIHDADALSDAQMLGIARELGFSESAFIQSSSEADFRVRFFASKKEVDFCGHATVAAFHSMIRTGVVKIDADPTVVTQETGAGNFPVSCYRDGRIMMAQDRPTFGAIETDRGLIARLLGLNEPELGPDMPIRSVSTAVPKLIVPVDSLVALRTARPDLQGIDEYCRRTGMQGFYLFTNETTGDEDLNARSFNPSAGIDEDAATGVAAGPLGWYADKHVSHGKQKRFAVRQGFDMGMESLIYVDVTHRTLVGGYAVDLGEKVVPNSLR